MLSPLTIDEGALDLFLDNLDPTVVGQAGSSLARTIHQGVDLLTLTNSGADRALVVMSDGEAFEPLEDVQTEAKRAAQQGISLVTVGFGTTEGTTIPIKNPDGSTTTKKDENGSTVITNYHPEFLKGAADAAGGTFIPAGATDKAARIKSALATLRTQARASLGGETKTPRYQWFLFPALLLLLLDTLLIERRGRRAPSLRPRRRPPPPRLLLMVSLNGCARLTRSQQAASAYHHGQYTQAASLFRDAITAGDKSPETLYNFGTALVAADSNASAVEALGSLIDIKNDELRFRTLFNLGLAHLKPGLAAPAGTGRRRARFDARRLQEGAAHASERPRREVELRARAPTRSRRAAGVAAAVAAAVRARRRSSSRRSRRAVSDSNRRSSCSAARRAKSATCSRRRQKAESRRAAAWRKGLVIGALARRRAARDRRARAGLGVDVRGVRGQRRGERAGLDRPAAHRAVVLLRSTFCARRPCRTCRTTAATGSRDRRISLRAHDRSHRHVLAVRRSRRGSASDVARSRPVEIAVHAAGRAQIPDGRRARARRHESRGRTSAR